MELLVYRVCKYSTLSDHTKCFPKWVFRSTEVFSSTLLHHLLLLVDLIFSSLMTVISGLMQEKALRWTLNQCYPHFPMSMNAYSSFGDLYIPNKLLPPGFTPAQPFSCLGRDDPIRGLMKKQPFQGNPVAS